MKDYKQRAERILERRDKVLAARHRRKSALYKYSVPAAALCAVIAVCFGAVMWDGNVAPDPSKIISDIHSSSNSENEAVIKETSAPNENEPKTTTSTSVSAADISETQTIVTDTAENNYDTSYEQPAVTEKPAVSGPAVTETVPQTEEIYDEDIISPTTFTLTHLLASDDPIWVFSEINYNGIEYHGCRYISEGNKNIFYTPWCEETDFTVAKKDREVTEPVTVYGLSDKEETQDYIIVRFNNYNIYALYESSSAQSDEGYVPEY